MTNVMSIDQRLTDLNLTAEDRARALRAAYAGEIVGQMFSALGRGITGLVRYLRERAETRRSIAYLAQLDDRLLADIGLSHATLEETLNGSAHNKGMSSVEVEIADMIPTKVAANQDHRDHRTAA